MENLPQIFISYIHWQSDDLKELFIKKIITKFSTTSFSLKINPVHPQTGGELDNFLSNQLENKYIILIIDEKYLSFPGALYELFLLSKYENIYFRIIPVILGEVRYFKFIELIDYEFYWGNKISYLYEKLYKITNSLYHEKIEDELDFYMELRRVTSNFSSLCQSIFLTPENADSSIENIYQQILIKNNQESELSQHSGKPNYLNKCPYFVHKNLTGRSYMLDRLDQLLAKNKMAAVTSKMPGMGKTTIIKAYINYEHFIKNYANIGWVTVTSSIQESMVDQLSKNKEIINDIKETDIFTSFRYVIKELQQLEGRNLLVLDNITDEKNLRQVKNELESLKWGIILICDFEPHDIEIIAVDKIDKEEAKKLFYRYYRKEQNDLILEHLLKLINHHPMLIELMAKSANQNTKQNIIKLYELVKKARIKNVALPVFVNQQNREISQNEQLVYNFLTGILDSESFSQEEEKYLRQMALLSPHEVDENTLIQLFQIKKFEESDFYNVINKLIKKGWVQDNQNTYSIHSLIQPVLYNRYQPDSNNCSEIISFLFDYFEKPANDINDKKKYLPYVENIINTIEHFDKTLSKLTEKVAEIYMNSGNYPKCLEYNFKALAIKETMYDSNHPEIAKCYNDISMIYGHLGNYPLDLEFSIKALEIRKKSLNSDDPLLAESYNNVAITYRILGEYDKSIKYHLRDVQICESIFDEKNTTLATSYYETAVTYYYLKDYKKAEYFINKAVQIWHKTFPIDFPDLQNALEIQEIIKRKSGFKS